VLFGATHCQEAPGVFLSDSDSFETPLGEIFVDRRIGDELHSCSTIFETNDIPHLEEYSLELLMPFIQYCFPGASIVPVLMGKKTPPVSKALAGAFNVVFRAASDETLFALSTCLSKNDDEKKAIAQAELFVKLLLEGDGEEIEKAHIRGEITACGAPYAAALLRSGLLGGKKCRALSPEIQSAHYDSGWFCYGSFAID
jgi:AmmeMemoRadiSam system protein B